MRQATSGTILKQFQIKVPSGTELGPYDAISYAFTAEYYPLMKGLRSGQTAVATGSGAHGATMSNPGKLFPGAQVSNDALLITLLNVNVAPYTTVADIYITVLIFPLELPVIPLDLPE